jgi:hypothetical protein
MSTTTDFQTGQTSAQQKDFLLWMSDFQTSTRNTEGKIEPLSDE